MGLFDEITNCAEYPKVEALNYDFKFGDGKHTPKVQKDSLGRKIRRTD